MNRIAKFLGGTLLLAITLTMGAAMADWAVGHHAEILWKGKWYPGVILESAGGKYKVHYDGYAASWDEWVSHERIRVDGGGWKKGHRVEVLWKGVWYKATVLEEGAEKWKVHYDGYGAEWDEWVSYARIRRL